MMLKHILSDDESLSAYCSGRPVTFEDVKRRMFLSARRENLLIPDHHYRLAQTKDFEGIGSIEQLLRLGLYKIAKEHLNVRGNRIHVLQEKQNSWQRLMTYLPPLVLQSAYLHIENPITDNNLNTIREYYKSYILPNARYTALPYPYIPQLEHYVSQKKGFHDLHMHLSGSTETDIAWQDFLNNPGKIYFELQQGFSHNKVREQWAQESHLKSPSDFYKLLCVAKKIRNILFDFLFPSSTDQKHKNYNIDSIFDDILNDNSENQSYENPFASLVGGGNDHQMAIESLMYILIFKYLSKNPREIVASLFHFYLLILGLSNRLLVQQIHQNGFEQFQKHTLNGLRETSEKEYRKAFLQLHGNEFRNINFLEGRFSPKNSEGKSLDLLHAIIKGWDALLEKVKFEILSSNDKIDLPQLKLIAHFIKQEDNSTDYSIRHKELRYALWSKATVLSLIIKNHSDYKKIIVGIDAAASEFDAPPEVFSPIFRMLRRKGLRHFTYHAGEDFFHIISGLRAVYEAVEFNNLGTGDRIGHATATGLSTCRWAKTIGAKMFIRRGEWLDNLIFTYHLIISKDIDNLKKDLPNLANTIHALSHIVYDEYYTLKLLEDAWLFRKYCPILSFCESEIDATQHAVFDFDEWQDIKREIPIYKGNEILKVHAKYHSSDFKEKYNEIIEINTNDIFTNDDLEHLQIEVLQFLHSKEIVIETLPTSNVRIGFHSDYSTYHLWNWIKWENEGKAIPPIIVGSDDSGIFATNIYNEYANIYCSLINDMKISHGNAMAIIEKLDKNGQIYRFE